MKNLLYIILISGSALFYSCEDNKSNDSESNTSSMDNTEAVDTANTEATADTMGGNNEKEKDDTDYGNGSTRTSGNSGH